MGWFSSFCSAVSSAARSVASSVGNAVSSAARSVGNAISSGLSWAREKASQACDWIAEKGEQFIDNVKNAYQVVKPFLQKARPWIDSIAKVVTAAGFPWVGSVIAGAGKVIDGLFALENSPVAKKLEQALRGVIKFAQFVKQRYLTPEELEEAQEYQQELNKTEQMPLDEEQRKSIQLLQMLNNYAIIKVQLRDILEMGVGDFQHYLRLRAVQKLLDEADEKLTKTTSLDQVNADDVFLINTAQRLLETAELSENDTIKLDEITQERFGKSLIPFVFEELILVWVQKQLELEKAWKECSQEVAKDKVLKNRLEIGQKVSELTAEEKQVYDELLPRLTGLETKLKRLDKERRSMKSYVYAAEGFMQILEKDDGMLQAEDKDYLIDDSAEIASIIMKVAQNNVDWDMLTTDEQNLITDYANIFEQEGKARAEHLAQEIGMEMSA